MPLSRPVMSQALLRPPGPALPGLLVRLGPSSGMPKANLYVETVESQDTFVPAGIRIFLTLSCFGASYLGGATKVPG